MPTHFVFACSQTEQYELSVSLSSMSIKADKTMANKENMSPRADPGLFIRDGSTPPGNLSGTLGMRHWQHSALNHSPPFAMLSPNSKPSLARQRDHSACRKTDSPLKVRKTRENLKQASSIYADVAPPCVHTGNGDGCLSPGCASPAAPPPSGITSPTHFDSGTTLTANPNDGPPNATPTSTPGKMLRHKSVSRRMLSKVKEGISNRSRSSHSMRNTEPEPGLIRRISNRRKQSSEEQNRLRAFEISRDSIESQDLDVDTSASQRSFTDSSISTDEIMASGTLMTPPSMASNSRPIPDRQFSDRLLSPSPTPHSPSPDPTPRPHSRFTSLAVEKDIADLQATIPYMDLKISLDRDSVNIGLARDVWVAIEATVRTKSIEANSSSTYSSSLRTRPLDAIIVLDQNLSTSAGSIAHQCIVELCSRLDTLGDKLAVLSAKRSGPDGCDCALLHALMPPSTALVLERLGLVPSTTGEGGLDSMPEHQFQPMQQLFRTFLDQGLQHENVQVFVISRAPSSLVQSIGSMVNWPVHTLKVELGADENASNVLPARHNWAVDFRGTADVQADLIDNMFRDLRHGCSLGSVTSLRLCYKPLEKCRILETIGQKAVKDLRFGQRTSLFLKVHVPRIPTPETEKASDSDSLFVELESMLGTLESNFLHVEARYRHTALPTENVVTVREICTIKRPKTDSRWSVVGDATTFAMQSDVHTKLAQFLATYYAPNRALKMIDRWTLQQSTAAAAVQQVRRFLEGHSNKDGQAEDSSWTATSQGDKPSVVITDIDTTTNSSTQISTTDSSTTQQPSTATGTTQSTLPPTKLPTSPSTATIITSPKTTTAISLTTPESADTDTARQLWNHLRRNSQSASQMLQLSSPEQVEESDESGMVKMLRQKALVNKRSVGAETLRGWRWEGQVKGVGGGEAPWL
ncbi:hypothetical protein PRZ48_004627 [Zasmidium cellare]|uniref:Uncharacterized protein n=1 Tax=Zasmidium cellare TaxID=395010 RepID=A0ABR0EQB4_ZASCE|nr:hypothetical protein PRZ48_004627 [Zasmidium cellare]